MALGTNKDKYTNISEQQVVKNGGSVDSAGNVRDETGRKTGNVLPRGTNKTVRTS